MLSDEELARIARDTESDRVERKESLSDKERVGQAICAFSNDLPGHGQPGVVLIGVNDAGNPVGTTVDDRLLQTLAGFRSDGNILPLPNLVVEKRVLEGKDIAVVLVQPCSDPPVRYYGQVWIRVGPRRAIASRDEERTLTERRQTGDLPFDRRGVLGASLEDLDIDFFQRTYLPGAVAPEVLEENHRSLEEQLSALHLLDRRQRPTYAALLLLGKAARSWLPGAYVQFVRFDGEDLGAPILDQKELSGHVSDILRRVDDLATINIRIETAVESDTVEQRRPDYPLVALQQILRNAVLHRTYEVHAPVYWYWFKDRIEIHSPGGLYGRVNEQNFGAPGATDYRNPTLAEGLKVLGLVQRFGMGIDLARRRCRDNGNPEPVFEFSQPSVLVTIRRRP